MTWATPFTITASPRVFSEHRGVVVTTDGDGRNVALVRLHHCGGGHRLLMIAAETGESVPGRDTTGELRGVERVIVVVCSHTGSSRSIVSTTHARASASWLSRSHGTQRSGAVGPFPWASSASIRKRTDKRAGRPTAREHEGATGSAVLRVRPPGRLFAGVGRDAAIGWTRRRVAGTRIIFRSPALFLRA